MGLKLGIVFAFLLSVAAAVGSYYLYQGWLHERSVRGSVETKYGEIKEKILAVQSEKEQFKKQSEEYRTKAEAMKDQLKRLQADQHRIDSEKNALAEQLKSHQVFITNLQKKVEDLEKQAKEARESCAVTPADLKTTISITKPLEGTVVPGVGTPSMPPSPATNNLQPASASNPQGANVPSVTQKEPAFVPPSSAAAAVMKNVASGTASEKTPRSEVAPAPAPTVQAPAAPVSEPVPQGPKILTVNRKFNFVVVNLGLQDGVKMGDKLKALKHGKECATLQVEKLYDKFSAATIVEENAQLQVVEGDEIRKI